MWVPQRALVPTTVVEREKPTRGIRRGAVPNVGCGTSVTQPFVSPMLPSTNICRSADPCRTRRQPTSRASSCSSHAVALCARNAVASDLGELVVVPDARGLVGEARRRPRGRRGGGARRRARPTPTGPARRGTPSPRRSRRAGSARRDRAGRHRRCGGAGSRRTRPCPRRARATSCAASTSASPDPVRPRSRATSPSNSAVATPSAEKPSACATDIAAWAIRSAAGFTTSTSSSGPSGADAPRLRIASPAPAPIVGAKAGR